MQKTTDGYVHAMGHRLLTPLYDPFVRLSLRERRLRHALIERLALRDEATLLDVGCGTGTLAIWTKGRYSAAKITGIDGDPEIIRIARRKADAAGKDVCFGVALATELPFDDEAFDCVTSTFVMHHLPLQAKSKCLEESFRVLRTGGSIHIVDFGPPRNRTGRALMGLLRGMASLADNLAGLLPRLLVDAGFVDVEETGRIATAFGPAIFLSGRRPGTRAGAEPTAGAHELPRRPAGAHGRTDR